MQMNRDVVFTFRYVEDSLEEFKDDGQNVVKWLDEFEGISVTCGWGQIQVYLYARKLLKGAAKLAVESGGGVNTCVRLQTFGLIAAKCAMNGGGAGASVQVIEHDGSTDERASVALPTCTWRRMCLAFQWWHSWIQGVM